MGERQDQLGVYSNVNAIADKGEGLLKCHTEPENASNDKTDESASSAVYIIS